MKKAISAFMICTLLCSLAACQPTPSKAVVVPKDSERMIETAQSEPAGTSDSGEDMPSMAGNAPYVDSFYGTTNDFHVNIDADVMMPELSNLPIIRVTAAEFDEEIANRFYHLLCGDTDMYTQAQFETKPILAQKILEAKQVIEDGEDTDGYIEDFYLKELQEKYNSAPDAASGPIQQVTLTEQEALNDGSKSFLVYSEYPLSQKFRGKYFGVKSSRADGDGFLSESALYYADSSVYAAADPLLLSNVTGQTAAPDGTDLSLTPTEAQRQAEQLLRDAGVTDMQASAVYLAWNVYTPTPGSDPLSGWVTDQADAAYVYWILFQRIAKGIPVVSPTVWASVVGDSEQYGSSEWRYERLHVQINDQGIAYLHWMAPLNIGEVIVEDSKLLPFAEIMGIFKTMIRVKNEAYVMEKETYHMATYAIDVSRITLSLQRIAEKDSVTTGLLVPVWNFWGAETRVYEDGTTSVRGNDIGSNTEAISLLSINAIDGSIIDASKGY